MSAVAPLAVRSWRVGPRTCTLTIPPLRRGEAMHAVFEWAPDAPRSLFGREWDQYREGRDDALAEIARQLGISVAVIDV